jgi:hypothetical protein
MRDMDEDWRENDGERLRNRNGGRDTGGESDGETVGER